MDYLTNYEQFKWHKTGEKYTKPNELPIGKLYALENVIISIISYCLNVTNIHKSVGMLYTIQSLVSE